MTKPISPVEAKKLEGSLIPEFVIDAFNEMIVENYRNGRSQFTQESVIHKIRDKQNVPQQFDYKWLDVEPLFRAQGWKVEYDKPGYNEDYRAHFVFSDK